MGLQSRVLQQLLVQLMVLLLPGAAPGDDLPPRRSPTPLRRQLRQPATAVDPNSARGLAWRNNALIETQPAHIPTYTAEGFKIIATPDAVHEDLVRVLQSGRAMEYWEFPEHSFSLLSEYPNGTATSTKVDVPQRMQSTVLYEMAGALSQWSNQELVAPKFYGMRVYRRGSTLGMHLDSIRMVQGQLDARVLSAIVHVAQRTEEDWPLCIQGNDGLLHNVTVQPGQTILYESARLAHGRPFPLIGEEYVNAFIHFKPAGWTMDEAARVRNHCAARTQRAPPAARCDCSV